MKIARLDLGSTARLSIILRISIANEWQAMSAQDAYSGLQLYYGDIHNHCNLSYGQGQRWTRRCTTPRLQLDFASVTLHGTWDDMPQDDPRLAYLINYHRQGFERGRAPPGASIYRRPIRRTSRVNS